MLLHLIPLQSELVVRLELLLIPAMLVEEEAADQILFFQVLLPLEGAAVVLMVFREDKILVETVVQVEAVVLH